jgi:hypothetical protein
MEQHESKRDGDEINTGGGSAIGRDVDAGRDFVGRDSAGNVTHNYYSAQSEPRPRRRRSTGELTVAEASVLWEAINRLSETVGSLRSSIDAGNRETSRLSQTIDERERQTAEQYKIMEKAITTIQGSLAELGLTPKSQRAPQWKTDLLVWSTTIIAICAFFGLTYLLFGGA